MKQHPIELLINKVDIVINKEDFYTWLPPHWAVNVTRYSFGDIARAKGMSQVARDSGLSRESLYKALSGDRNPNFDTILKVIAALGLKLHAEAKHSHTA